MYKFNELSVTLVVFPETMLIRKEKVDLIQVCHDVRKNDMFH